MFRRMIALAGIIILGASSGFAQHKVEVGGFGGWSFSDGVSGATYVAPGGNYNRVDPKDSGLWGFNVSALLGEGAALGFIYSRQSSNLLLGGTLGTPDRELGSMAISNYHGTIEYNFLEDGTKVRPFLYAGFGATNFGSVDYSRITGTTGTISSSTRFSTQWGAGVKYFVSPSVAIRGAVNWIPTYVKSDYAGYWCDPFWGCYSVGDPQYSNQFHLTGGVSFRF